jgi:hypothetical protein
MTGISPGTMGFLGLHTGIKNICEWYPSDDLCILIESLNEAIYDGLFFGIAPSLIRLNEVQDSMVNDEPLISPVDKPLQWLYYTSHVNCRTRVAVE